MEFSNKDDVIHINLRTTTATAAGTNSKTKASTTSTTSTNSSALTDFVEIKAMYLNLLKGTWIKYKDGVTGDYYSGGFLINVTDDHIVLRNVQQKIFNVEKNCVFYCKNNTENYYAVQEIIIERQKLAHERYLLNLEKIKFNEDKKKFFGL